MNQRIGLRERRAHGLQQQQPIPLDAHLRPVGGERGEDFGLHAPKVPPRTPPRSARLGKSWLSLGTRAGITADGCKRSKRGCLPARAVSARRADALKRTFARSDFTALPLGAGDFALKRACSRPREFREIFPTRFPIFPSICRPCSGKIEPWTLQTAGPPRTDARFLPVICSRRIRPRP